MYFKHGLTRTPAWNAWASMMNRCYCSTSTAYKDYGGRGIVVSASWHDFEGFLADMGQPPEGMELERNDNDGPYDAANCRWATHKEQCRNRRSTRWQTLNGRTQSLAAWADEVGIPYKTLWARLKYGIPFEQAVLP